MLEQVSFNFDNLTNEEKELIKNISEKSRKNVVWKPEMGEYYYCINDDGFVSSNYWANDNVDNNIYEIGNCYETEEDAKFDAECRKVLAELKRYALKHNEFCDNPYTTETSKFYIGCTVYGEIEINEYDDYLEYGVIFSSESVAEEAINVVGKDRIKKYYFGIKED